MKWNAELQKTALIKIEKRNTTQLQKTTQDNKMPNAELQRTAPKVIRNLKCKIKLQRTAPLTSEKVKQNAELQKTALNRIEN